MTCGRESLMRPYLKFEGLGDIRAEIHRQRLSIALAFLPARGCHLFYTHGDLRSAVDESSRSNGDELTALSCWIGAVNPLIFIVSSPTASGIVPCI
jgi:hypothetical protein